MLITKIEKKLELEEKEDNDGNRLDSGWIL